MNDFKFALFGALMLTSQLSMSGSTSNAAVPTLINVIDNRGFMIHGQFGNPNGCTEVTNLWVPLEHPQYNTMYSTALAAFMAGKKLAAFSNTCITVGYYVTPDRNFNTVSSLHIK